ncbi:DUF6894 family protein [Methylobacterium nonmethylotrophicum]|uniref:DUF6894 domain-containing protein n=1 Tax=Methylobacterium nonmethylotrophicum TaxID=1141884 RepID=A0A4Z0NP36_9HYPH|nr:hypothetical protein [Methylobacterium nonmethylotrophicum]TGD97692.1 hypothetical protein EU555_18840 [Methylobacterium nonmethylotrophicum]
MLRFFFHIFDGAGLFDPVGRELPVWQASQTCAIAATGEVLQRDAARIAPGEDWHLDITDELGLLLFRLDSSIVRSAVMAHAHATRLGRRRSGLDVP